MTTLAVAEFNHLIDKAQNGNLRNVREVKPLRTSNLAPLYELRWQSISVIGGQNISVRMYHSEPITAPGFFIGHHIHVKDLSFPELIHEVQDREIEIAMNFFESGLSTNWGLRS